MHRIFTILIAALVLTFTAAAPAPAQTQKLKQKLKANQYKRVHQYGLKLILNDEAKRCIDEIGAYAAEHNDAESHFILTLAHANLGDLATAEEHMGKAIELGIDPARVIAGPRELVKPLEKVEAYQQIVTSHDRKPLHGPMIGDVTDAGAKVWFRISPQDGGKFVTLGIERVQSNVQVNADGTISGTGGGGRIRTHAGQSMTDHTVVLETPPLEPDTEYRYTVLGTVTTFRTAPKPGTPTKFRVAFGGGAGFVPENERVWTTIANEKPDILVLLGDNIYSDDPETSEMQRYCYYRRQSRPEWRKLTSTVPVYAIWDDHDFGTNDCLGGVAVDEPKWKPDVLNVFKQNWANPYYGTDEAPGVFFDFVRGDVHFIMLDGRSYRTDQKHKPRPTMLGPVQLAWLKTKLKESEGTIKVLCSPVPWVFEAKGDSKDTWNGFKDERNEIFDFIRDNRIEGVVLMSADRHRSDAWEIKHPGLYPLYEFNSSRLTNQHVHPEMKDALFSYNKKQSFGTVDFDTTAADPTVTYTIVSIDGDKPHTLTVKRSDLTFK